MTDAEKDRHILALEERAKEQERRAAEQEEQIESLELQVRALYRVFLEPDPTVPGGGTLVSRIMEVVTSMERGTWAIKWTFRVVTGVGALIGAIYVILSTRGGQP